MKNALFVSILGITFLTLGIVGFVNNPILGLFEVNTAHNVLHLLSGILAFVALVRGEIGAILYGKVMAIFYGIVTILGFLLIPVGGVLLGMFAMNTMDHVLHILLTVIFTYIGFVNRMETVRG